MTENRIVATPGTLVGKPRIRGTRVSVELILESLAAGETIESLLEDYPFLQCEDVLAALKYAAEVVGGHAPVPSLARTD